MWRHRSERSSTPAPTRFVEAPRIRVLYGVIVLVGGVAVVLVEVSQAFDVKLLSTLASVVLLGAGGGICLWLAGLLLRSRWSGEVREDEVKRPTDTGDT